MSRDVDRSRSQSGMWQWRCWECGWVGLNCDSESFAKQESSRHVCPDGDADGQGSDW